MTVFNVKFNCAHNQSTNMNILSPRFVILCLLGLGLAVDASSARAQTFSWVTDGGSTYSWSDTANWNPNTSYPNGSGVVAEIYKNFTIASSFGINITSNPTIGTLKVGDTGSSPTLIRFTGGSGGALTFQVASGTAALNKSTANEVDFRKRVNFVSDTIVTNTGGTLRWSYSSATNTGSIGGNGNLYFEGAGGTTVFDSSLTSVFSSSYGGNIQVRNGGTLLVNGTLNAFSSARTVTVGSTGHLGGTGTVERATTIQSGGHLSPGTSPGIMTFSNSVALASDSNFNFELIANSTSGRGTSFDGVNVTGGTLSVTSGADFNLTFNGVGSTVNFANAFWDTDQSWLVFDNTNAPTVALGIFDVGTISVDSVGASFATTTGSFSFAQTGNDIYLVYTIPEPSTWTMLVVAGVALVGTRRRISRSC